VEGDIATRHEEERLRVLRVLQGDPSAFRDLYDTCFQLAWACAWRSTGDRREAERLTADALRSTFAALAQFDGATSLGHWVLERVERALLELRREAQPQVDAEAELGDQP
jgi:DNA-directed RNA polymerase specialized sigma24 family protein